MQRPTFFAGYAILVGFSMVGMWSMLLATGQVPELYTQRLNTLFHLTSEFLTAGLLLAAGFATLRRQPWGRPLLYVALGMLLYATLTAAGYYGQAGETVILAMFLLLATLAIVAVLGMLPRPGGNRASHVEQ